MLINSALYIFIGLMSVHLVATRQKCPRLRTDFSQDSCTARSAGDDNDSFYYDFDETSCVPKCKKYADGIYKNCSTDEKCMPGYTCQKRCGPDDSLKHISCITDSDCTLYNAQNENSNATCEFYCMAESKASCMAYHINTEDYKNTYWSAKKFKPSCNDDGTWKAKQCKGGNNGRCLCYDSVGNRIFGEALIKDATNMTCACSRHQAEAKKLRDTTFHCDSMGNYEPLQCDKLSGQCWCAEPTTGELFSAIVPEKAIDLLPCYSKNTYGEQYLRQCESKKFAQARIKSKLNAHGVTYVREDFLLCNEDGSYGAYTVEKDSVYCTWRNNTKMGTWQTDTNSGYSDLNCNCARDTYTYGASATQVCLSTGNYKPLQNDLDNWYCVDEDGFSKSDLLTNLDTDTDDSYCSQYY